MSRPHFALAFSASARSWPHGPSVSALNTITAAQRAQRGQFRGRGQLAQSHQRADHRSRGEHRVGPARHGVQHPGRRGPQRVAILADDLELAGEGHHHIQAHQHRPGQQHRGEHRPAQVQVETHRAQPHARAPFGRPRRPSRAYSQIDSASSGRVNHHRPIAAGILPVAIQPLPMNIRLVPTM
ncbi:hypothetical protein G6F63_014329 [Rhizopus arrhizus]|nr:hypothetical protein G6F63_014329 [Rhizopus arrhizus]